MDVEIRAEAATIVSSAKTCSVVVSPGTASNTVSFSVWVSTPYRNNGARPRAPSVISYIDS